MFEGGWVVRIMLLALFLIAAAALRSSSFSEYLWEFEWADAPKNFDGMSHRSLAIDGEGNLYIAYGGDQLYLAVYDGVEWHYQTVDDDPSVGGYASIAMDKEGQPHISYFDDLNDDLRYAFFDGSEWRIQIMNTEAGIGGHNALALDGLGHPHFAYQDKATQSMVYKYWNGLSWELETFNENKGKCVSLALDAEDQPHISYQNTAWAYAGLVYCFRDESGWHSEGLPSGGGLSRTYNPNSLALDRSGSPHLVYHFPEGCTAGYLIYASRDSSGWRTVVVDYDDFAGRSSSLVLDPGGNPHVCYAAGFDEEDSRYAYRDDSGWHIARVDSSGASCVSLCMDSRGRLHTSYSAYPNLKHAFLSENAWQTEIIDTKAIAGTFTSLEVDSEDVPHISYSSRSIVKYAWKDINTWHIDIVDGDASDQSYSSLELDRFGYPHMAYTAWQSLRYAFFNGDTWQIDTIEPESGGSKGSLGLDSSDKPHIAYRGSGQLKYACLDGAQWQKEIVDPNYIGDLSLDLSQAGFPSISYFADAGNMLKYVFRDEAGWHIEVVDSTGDAGEANSLIMDGLDRPHISYFDRVNSILRYAHWNGISWQNDSVDQDLGEYLSSISITLDGLGLPHISYAPSLASGRRILKHAFWNGTRWYAEVVDSSWGEVGSYNSLALDSQGMPHVSYYDQTTHDLKYAHATALHSGVPQVTWPPRLIVDIDGSQPCFGSTMLRLYLPATLEVRLSVYDVSGRRVRVLNHGILPQGEHRMTWNGIESSGHRVPSGTYIISAEAGGERVSKRIVVIR